VSRTIPSWVNSRPSVRRTLPVAVGQLLWSIHRGPYLSIGVARCQDVGPGTRGNSATIAALGGSASSFRSMDFRERLPSRHFGEAGEGGGFINPSNLRQRSFIPLLRRAGLPQITFHDLASHLRLTPVPEECPSEARPGAARARLRRHNARHLQPHAARHGRRSRRRDGSGSGLKVVHSVSQLLGRELRSLLPATMFLYPELNVGWR
jgi:hypothetical protein